MADQYLWSPLMYSTSFYGMVAIRVGLGQLFIDIAHCVAGRLLVGQQKSVC